MVKSAVKLHNNASKTKQTGSLRTIKKEKLQSLLRKYEQMPLQNEHYRRAFRLVTKGTLANLLPNHYEYLQLDGTKKIAKLLVYNYIRELFDISRSKNISLHSKKTDELELEFKDHSKKLLANPLHATV